MSKERKNNLTIKIFALIIAVILWGYVMDEVNPKQEREFRNIQVKYNNVASLERQGLEIMEPKEMDIKVTISGRRSDVLNVKDEDIIAEVDLNGYQEGEAKALITIDVPYMVQVVDYTPKEILFKFDKLIKKEKTVTLETVGDVPEGYSLGEAEIKPKSIYIEGPRSWVNSVSQVLATINIEDMTEYINLSVPINLLDDQGNEVRGVEKGQNTVEIFIPIYQTKKVPVELQTEGQLPNNYEVLDISINPSVVEIKGRKQDLMDISSIKTKVIDINSLIGEKNVDVDLDIPENISLTKPNQKIQVTLNVDESKTKTFEYVLNDVKIKNLDPDLIIDEKELNTSFEITVKGSSSKIDTLKKEDLIIELNLLDLEEGNHLVNPSIKDHEHITIISVLPEKIDINLKAKEKDEEEE